MANPVVSFEMENGDIIKAELYPEIAPNTVRNFVSLVSKGFYDGLIFHRVIRGFMIHPWRDSPHRDAAGPDEHKGIRLLPHPRLHPVRKRQRICQTAGRRQRFIHIFSGNPGRGLPARGAKRFQKLRRQTAPPPCKCSHRRPHSFFPSRYSVVNSGW